MLPLPDGARPPGEGGLYALVIYLPDPLGEFLDHLRLEMVPGCNPHAHVSVLPPRPLRVPPEAAIQDARRIVAGFDPFHIELGAIEKFDVTDVIYISVEGGADQLRQMHRALNQGGLECAEPFTYHPHITLAQDIAPDRVAGLWDLATRRWREFQGPRVFQAHSTVFVRNAPCNQWIDLAEEPLRGVRVG